MVFHAPEGLKTIFHWRWDIISFVFIFHLSKFSLVWWIKLRWKSLQLEKEIKRLLHLIVERLSHFLIIFQLLKDAVLTWCQSSNAMILLSMQEVELFFFFRLKLYTSVFYANEFFHPLLLVWLQVTFDVFVSLKEEGELLFLSGCHGLFKQSHCEVLL